MSLFSHHNFHNQMLDNSMRQCYVLLSHRYIKSYCHFVSKVKL